MEMLFGFGLRGRRRDIGFHLLLRRSILGPIFLSHFLLWALFTRLLQAHNQAVLCTRHGGNISVHNYYLNEKNHLLLHRSDSPTLLKSTYQNQTMLCRFERPVPSGDGQSYFFLFGKLNSGQFCPAPIECDSNWGTLQMDIRST
jgi:hypothetical protein